MRLTKPSVEIWDQEEGLNGVYKSIERAGRICYKSSDKITEDSAEPFVDRMIKSLHHSMLEQGTVYLTIPREDTNYHIYLSKYRDNPYSECRVAQTLEGIPVGSLYISTNYRVIIEHDWTDDLKYLCKPTKFHEKRISVHFTLDRAVSMEVLRHRKFSFAQESTRYCDYSKNKFNNEITYIIPIWLDVPETEYGTLLTPKDIQFKEYTNLSEKEFINHLLDSEYRYFNLLKLGWTPQQARQVLPNALKTELVMTGFISDWKHFIDLRYRGTTGKPHPDAFYLAEKLYNLFKEKGIEI